MSIESSSAVQSHRSVAGANHRGGNKAGKADSAGGGVASGFSMLMDLLAEPVAQADSLTVAGEAALLAQPGQPVLPGPGGAAATASVLEQNMPPALAGYALTAMSLVASQDAGKTVTPTDTRALMTGLTGATQSANVGVPTWVGQPVLHQKMAPTLAASALPAINLVANPNLGKTAALVDIGSAMTATPISIGSAMTGQQSASPGGKVIPTSLGADPDGTDLGEKTFQNFPFTLSLSKGNEGIYPAASSGQAKLSPNGQTLKSAPLGAAPVLNQKVAQALAASALPAINFVANPDIGKTLASPAVSGLTLDGKGAFQGNKPAPAGLAGVTGADLAQVATRSEVAGSEPASRDQPAAGQLMQTLPDGPPVHKGWQQSPSLTTMLSELRDAKSHSATLDLAATSDLGNAMLASGAGDALVPTQNRFGAKPLARPGAAGAEGWFGSASAVNARADAPYEIEAAAATVPDTAVAETVSYWATHGVQSAKLTLEGFGSEPVEVSISLTGDQAQIDFRTNQADVRWVLEAATAQLRDLLSGEGLQLSGVSVGASGSRDAAADAQQPRQSAKPTMTASDQSAAPLASRSLNPSVGHTLDLFV